MGKRRSSRVAGPRDRWPSRPLALETAGPRDRWHPEGDGAAEGRKQRGGEPEVEYLGECPCSGVARSGRARGQSVIGECCRLEATRLRTTRHGRMNLDPVRRGENASGHVAVIRRTHRSRVSRPRSVGVRGRPEVCGKQTWLEADAHGPHRSRRPRA